LAADNHHGIFHLAGLSRMNRVELGQTIAARFGFRKELVVGQPPAVLPGRAARPRDVSLNARKARAQLKTPLRTLDEGLSLIIESRPKES
jgi:dTDP-4-dehydrorhamnose reductase